jgi:hypothetical protein
LSTVELPVELARDLAYEMVGSKFEDDGHNYEVIVNEQTDSNRWSAICSLVVTIDGDYYATTYEQGLTEMQDYGPFEEPEGDTITFRRVVPREKTVIEYVAYVEDK